MQIEYREREKVVGTFIIIIAALLLAAVVMIGRGQGLFKKYVIYYTTFNESYNLQTNAAVKLFKTDIGKVKQITLAKDRVSVKLAILEEYATRIRVDSVASVESPTFIGDEYVSIKPGRPDAPLIQAKGEIKSIEKRSISDFMGEFELEKTSKMLIQALQDLSEIAQALRDPEGPLFSALNNMNRILGDIEAGKGTLGSLLKSRELMDSTLVRLDQAGGILSSLDQAAAQTPETMTLVNSNLTTLSQIGDDVADRAKDIERILIDVEESVAKLKVILTNMEAGSHDIPEITHTTKVGIQEIREGVKRIDTVVSSIRKSALVRSNLPRESAGETIDAGLRP
jgi:phospholipid/cholesterol/gamma-HCH transport system substrate-binding protein